ncbi:MAG TPA: carboxypeptidase-like regulatory domain-containing protein [Pyrinomonadaceae bacterium]|nr:carboxypeptidase-like regulatory domain-containing protein [Pyrinomonadaceae bacterium]
MNRSLTAHIAFLIVCVVAATVSISAQKSMTWQKSFAPEAIGVNIEQCANGPQAAPIHCNVASANDGYTRGNLIASKSHYLEGDSVPIRIVMEDLGLGSTYTVTIGYDYTKGGKYANDYLTDYDRTESVQNDPCVGVVGCTLASETTFPIPADAEVAAGFDEIPATADDIAQIAGSFSCFGCTITGVSGYTRTGDQSGDSTKSLVLTFTANQTNAVIAYGSHISTRSDWGLENSAINITGSPYHNYIVDFPGSNQGNRDLQLSAEAVIFPAQVTIIKAVTTLGAPPGSTATFEFNFTSSANLGTTGFTLVDNVSGNGGGGTASQNYGGLVLFGGANAITVTEANYAPIWTLSQIQCVEDRTANTTTSLGTRTATITLEEGESVTCTFFNTQLTPTAAQSSISGRVADATGYGVAFARVNVQNASTGEVRSALTNNFGYYTVDGLSTGDFFMVTVSHKRYSFPTQFVTLDDNVSGFDFTANPE